MIPVAVGVLQNPQSEVLLALRPKSSHQGGLWEFPGGKIEPGESVEQALQRELAEELGIQVQSCRPLIQVSHRYSGRQVRLHTWLIERWHGEPRGMEGQPLRWVRPEELPGYAMPAADRPILEAIRLPPVYLITPPECAQSAAFLGSLEKSLDSGVRLVQFRVFDLGEAKLQRLYRDCRRLCQRYSARLLLNSGMTELLAQGRDGLHLNQQHLMQASQMRRENELIAASCHDPRQLRIAAQSGLNFVVLSPVLTTTSHPHAHVLGWDAFSRLLAEVNLPVYALGGMTAGHLSLAWRQGAQGIAGISGLWGADIKKALPRPYSISGI